jgi:hypothetical protein
MTAINSYLQTLYELFKLLILVVLFSIAGASFSVNANAAGKEGEAGGIVIGRDVPQRSAFRPSLVPGNATFVSTSPAATVKDALGVGKSNNSFTPLKELNEKDFAAITADSPLQHINSEINVEGGGVPNQFAGAGLGQGTSGISATMAGSSGIISNSVNRATSAIGQTISGATGFLK